MSNENKTVGLKDKELEIVAGGQLENGHTFGVNESWPGIYNGEWFAKDGEPNFIYNVYSSGFGNTSFIANRYWHHNGEAWPYGTCSFGRNEIDLHVVDAPMIVHTEYTGIKPF